MPSRPMTVAPQRLGTLNVVMPSPVPYVVPTKPKYVAYVVREIAWPQGKMKLELGDVVQMNKGSSRQSAR